MKYLELAHQHHRSKAPHQSSSSDEGRRTYDMYLENLTKPPEPLAWVGNKKGDLLKSIENMKREQQRREEEVKEREKEKERKKERERRWSRSTSGSVSSRRSSVAT